MHRRLVKPNAQIFFQNGKIIKIQNGSHRIARLNAFMSGPNGVSAIVNQKLIQGTVQIILIVAILNLTVASNFSVS